MLKMTIVTTKQNMYVGWLFKTKDKEKKVHRVPVSKIVWKDPHGNTCRVKVLKAPA